MRTIVGMLVLLCGVSAQAESPQWVHQFERGSVTFNPAQEKGSINFSLNGKIHTFEIVRLKDAWRWDVFCITALWSEECGYLFQQRWENKSQRILLFGDPPPYAEEICKWMWHAPRIAVVDVEVTSDLLSRPEPLKAENIPIPEMDPIFFASDEEQEQWKQEEADRMNEEIEEGWSQHLSSDYERLVGTAELPCGIKIEVQQCRDDDSDPEIAVFVVDYKTNTIWKHR